MKTASHKPLKSSAAGRAQRAAAGPARNKHGAPPAGDARAVAARTVAAQWTFLTNHAHVLVLLARGSASVLREVAWQVGITERAVQRIIADLEAAEIIVREKVGRQNRYQIRVDRPLRHPIEAHRTIGELLALLSAAPR